MPEIRRVDYNINKRKCRLRESRLHFKYLIVQAEVSREPIPQARFDRSLLSDSPDRCAIRSRLRFDSLLADNKKRMPKGILFFVGTAYGNRTHDLAVRGPRLNLLTKAAYG